MIDCWEQYFHVLVLCHSVYPNDIQARLFSYNVILVLLCEEGVTYSVRIVAHGIAHQLSSPLPIFVDRVTLYRNVYPPLVPLSTNELGLFHLFESHWVF